jgi:hypothetical protein
MKGAAIFEIGKYSVWVDYIATPREAVQINNIEFEPNLLADDISYKTDVLIPIGSTIASQNMILHYRRDCYILGQSLNDLIEREI